jgi:hypothetical protein
MLLACLYDLAIESINVMRKQRINLLRNKPASQKHFKLLVLRQQKQNKQSEKAQFFALTS